jgi:hypothetical protein
MQNKKTRGGHHLADALRPTETKHRSRRNFSNATRMPALAAIKFE